MRYWMLGLVSCVSVSLAAQQSGTPEPLVPPEKIEKEIEKAQKDFDAAKKMFNPWYTGPLLTPSAHVLTPGYINIQPYLFYTNNYGHFNEHGKSSSVPHLKQLNPSLAPLQAGITQWLDASLVVQGLYNHMHGHSYMNWGDTSFTLGFGLLPEAPYQPAIKFCLKEIFPTGNFQKFDPKKADVESTGAGSYQTVFSLNVSKVVWWLTTHPMNLRTSFNYTVPSHAHVRGINSYGGAPDTNGSVKVGTNFAWDFGYEYSFTQKWVAAFDIAYTYSWKSTFSGHTSAPVGVPFNDQLSLAPALEYNLNENFGFIAGVWATVWGRNSSNFISEIISFTWTF